MISCLRFSPLLCLVLTPFTHAVPSFPLEDGEQLGYRVSWAIVPGAGEIKIDARQDPMVRDRLIVTTTTATRWLARALLPFEAKAESIFDLKTGMLVSLRESNTTRAKYSEHTVVFNYATRSAIYEIPRSTEKPVALELPAGEPTDLIMGLLQTRGWNLKEGESRDALVLFDSDFYELTIHAVRVEEVESPLGRYKTTVLEPRMEKTAPKGMFKRGSSVRVWIAQDEHRLPLKFEVEFKIGTGTATLETYSPPSSTRGTEGTSPAGNPSTGTTSGTRAPAK